MARKKKKNKGILENKLSIAFVTTVVLAMAIALGVKVNSIKKNWQVEKNIIKKWLKNLTVKNKEQKSLKNKENMFRQTAI